MIEKAQVVQRMRRGGSLWIKVQREALELSGLAFCDAVTGGGGRDKLRAKFTGGVKAILDLDEYGTKWAAEDAEALEPPQEKQAIGGRRSATEAGEALRAEDDLPQEAAEAAKRRKKTVKSAVPPPPQKTPEEKAAAEALRRERRRAYDRERYRRKQARLTAEQAAEARERKKAYDAERYRRKIAAQTPEEKAEENRKRNEYRKERYQAEKLRRMAEAMAAAGAVAAVPPPPQDGGGEEAEG